MEYENAAPIGEAGLIFSRVKVVANAVSTVVCDSAVNAGGASRPHSQFEEPKDGSGGVSDSVSQHEWVSAAGFTDCCMWQSSPSPHRPQAPAIGAASARPGSSSAKIAAVRMEKFRFILTIEQYCTCFHFVKGKDSF